MAVQQDYIEATITDAEVIELDMVTEDLVTVNFTTVDALQDRSWVVETINDTLVSNELPTQLTVTNFRTLNNFVEGSLEVFFNGLKERNITVLSSTDFSMPIDIIVGDIIEVSYIKQ